MARLAGLFLISLYSQFCFGQTEVKTMFYNLLNFSSAPPTNRLEILNSILSTYEPDLFMVCEVESQRDAQDILNESFHYTSASIVQSPFLFNSSGASLIHQLVYYDSDKFKLNYTNQIETNVRSINHYSFELNTDSKQPFEVFVAHFKASRGESNVAERAFEAQQFINYIQTFPSDSNILLAGDFNMYSASEPGYQTLLNGNSNLTMIDPINEEGDWNNNSSFAGIQTQSTRTSTAEFDGFGAGGGLDDRFDIMLISDALNSNGNSISYIQDTYKALGNNANCFNNNINSIDCDGAYGQELREQLYLMSDHLPVVMDLAINEDFLSTTEFDSSTNVLLINGNVVSERLDLRFSPQMNLKKAKIYNVLGQEMTSFDVTGLEISLDVSSYSNGLYFLKLEKISNVEKFYVNH